MKKNPFLTLPLPFGSHVTAGNPVATLATELIKFVLIEGSTDATMRALHRRSGHDLDKVTIIGNPDLQK